MATRATFDSEQRVVNLKTKISTLKKVVTVHKTMAGILLGRVRELLVGLSRSLPPLVKGKIIKELDKAKQGIKDAQAQINAAEDEIREVEALLVSWWSTYQTTGKLPPLATTESPTGTISGGQQIGITLGEGLFGSGGGGTFAQLPSEKEKEEEKKGINPLLIGGILFFIILVIVAVIAQGKKKKSK